MLILFRRRGESIKISDGIEVFVAEIKGDKVRLGVSAPESMKICRTEPYLTVGNSKGVSDEVDLLKVFQLSRSPRALGTEGGRKKEGKNGTAWADKNVAQGKDHFAWAV